MRRASARAIGTKVTAGWPTRSSDEAPPRQLGPALRARRGACSGGANEEERIKGIEEVLEGNSGAVKGHS